MEHARIPDTQLYPHNSCEYDYYNSDYNYYNSDYNYYNNGYSYYNNQLEYYGYNPIYKIDGPSNPYTDSSYQLHRRRKKTKKRKEVTVDTKKVETVLTPTSDK